MAAAAVKPRRKPTAWRVLWVAAVALAAAAAHLPAGVTAQGPPSSSPQQPRQQQPRPQQQQPRPQQQQQQQQQQQSQSQQQQPFLAEQLPLKPLVTTPSELLTGPGAGSGAGSDGAIAGAVMLQGRQAITVVLSRPVIALGSDFGVSGALPASMVPFSLTCGTPGRLRWVTTSIARFDPSVDWPPDLDCAFEWNSGLKTYDGAPLQLGAAPPSVRLATAPLAMTLSGVQSAAADNATEGLWSADVGLPDDGLPEVPPGANVTLDLSDPVDLAALAGALKIVPAGGGGGGSIASKVSVLPCSPASDVTPFPRPPLFAPRAGRGGGGGGAAATTPANLLNRNATCAVVHLTPPLPPGAAALLRLPKGARYSALAGPTRADTDIKLFGLRRFRIPFRHDWTVLDKGDAQIYNGVNSRRLDMWLPHGLAAGVTTERLAPLLSLCRFAGNGTAAAAASDCTPVAFNLTRPTKGQLRMAAPKLEPRTRYRIDVAASDSIKDAFGLSLQASSTAFWSTDLEPAFDGPEVAGGDGVVLFEVAPGGATLTWPFVSRGKVTERGSARQWRLGPADAPKLAGALGGYYGVTADLFGPPGVTLARAVSAAPSFQALKLQGGPGMSLAGACCGTRGYPTSTSVLVGQALVLQSNLQAAFVAAEGDLIAWITDSQGNGTPVSGARVALYVAPGNGQGPAVAGPSCTTGADGACTVDAAAIQRARASAGGGNANGAGAVSAFITALGHGPLLLPRIPGAMPWRNGGGGDGGGGDAGGYKAAVVLDRALARPSDELRVTAFIQRVRGAQMLPPSNLGTVLVRVTPPFDQSSPSSGGGGGGGGGTPTLLTATVDGAFGTARVTLPVPSGARPGDYEISVLAPREGGSGGGGGGNGGPVIAMPAPAPRPTPARGLRQAIAGKVAGGAPMMIPRPRPDPSLEGYVAIGSAAFTVADPRPPTVELNATAPKWAEPSARVPVAAAVRSYIGSDVAGGAVAIDWSTPRAKGSLTLTTDAKGAAAGSIDLAALPAANATQAGETLELKATYIGPTREAVIVTESVRIADGPVRVELSRSLDTDLPGVAFGVAAAAYSNEDGARLDGTEVTIALTPANASAGATDCTPSQLAELAGKRCTVKAGDAAGAAARCQLALPCAGRFALRACAGGACTNMTLGRNATEWARLPWAAQPALTVLTDRAEYAAGATAKLVVQNPYWGPTSALVVWGNRLTRKSKYFASVVPGLATLPVGPLGEECRGCCQAVVVFAVARAGAGGSAAKSLPPLPRVPTSLLFDPLAPHTPVGRASITVPELCSPAPLDAKVAVEPAGGASTGGRAAAAGGKQDVVIEPNGTATIVVSGGGANAAAAAGAQVTVVVVDEAFLDLKPYPLQNVSAALTPDLSATMETQTLDDRRATRGALNATFAALQRRLAVDPFLPLFTRIQPGGGYMPVMRPWGAPPPWLPPPSAVDVPDSEYLAQYSARVTEWPAAGGPMYRRGAAAYARGGGFAGGFPMAMAAPAPAPAAAEAMGAVGAAAPMMLAKSAPGAANDAAAPAALAALARQSDGGGGGGQGGASVRLSSEFKATALYAVAVAGADGTARVTFRAPPNLGRFVVRAYLASAAAGEAATRYGAAEMRLIVRRPLSLVPSAPRIVRAGDAFEAGVVVSAPGASAPVDVTLTATAAAAASASTQPVALRSRAARDSVTVTIPAGGQTEARFKFSARAVGNATLRFAASSPDGGADALEVALPVLGRQGPVYVATSFAVRPPNASAPAARVEGLALPRAENGTGSLDLLAGVGHLPAVQATFEALAAQVPGGGGGTGNGNGGGDYRPTAPLSVSLAVLPAVLATYRPAAPPKAWLSPGQLGAALRGAADAAGPLTDSTLGLLYSAPTSDGGYAWRPERADVTLNSWAAWLVKEAAPAPAGDESYASAWKSLEAAATTWRAALGRQIAKDAADARAAKPEPRRYDDLESLSWARLALGSQWTPPPAVTGSSASGRITGSRNDNSSGGALIAGDLAFSRLTDAWRNLTTGGRARVGLVLAREGAKPATDPALSGILASLQSALRVGGRTAYVAAGAGARGSAGLADNALALALFEAVGVTPDANPLVEKLAAYVAEGPPRGAVGPLCVPVGGFGPPIAAVALARYDKRAGSADPDLTLNVTAVPAATAVSPVPLLSAAFTRANAGALARSSTPWARVPYGARLAFDARGRGEASVAAALAFVPADLLAFPTYRGLWVQRAIQLPAALNGSGSAAAAAGDGTPGDAPAMRSVASAPLASVVTVVVQVTTPDDVANAVVEVRMPGGLEPLDPNVYTDPDLATVCGQSEDENGGGVDFGYAGGGGGGVVAAPAPFVGAVAESGSGGDEEDAPVRRLRSRRLRRLRRRGLLSFAAMPFWRGGGIWPPWPRCPVQETLPAIVTLRYDWLRAGTHTARFKAVAATPGDFILPPVHAYAAKQPELMGLSPAGRFRVCPGACAPDAPAAVVSASVARPCPNDCSGSGVCNLAKGTCLCDAGFAGPSCATLAAS